jgi:hypothetical protein
MLTRHRTFRDRSVHFTFMKRGLPRNAHRIQQSLEPGQGFRAI